MKTTGNALAGYLAKMKGTGTGPPHLPLREILWSWAGAFLGISAVALINYRLMAGSDLLLVIGSFGASAVLIYGAIDSPLAQPRNLMGGHFLSAIVGVACNQLFGWEPWLAAAVAVASAIALMQLTRTLHPPGGATALIAVIGGPKIQSLGYLYVLVPATTGAAVMLLVALLVNNACSSRSYPRYWL